MMWPISTRVNSPKNDDAGLLDVVLEADACAPPDGNSAQFMGALVLPNGSQLDDSCRKRLRIRAWCQPGLKSPAIEEAKHAWP